MNDWNVMVIARGPFRRALNRRTGFRYKVNAQ